ncbi:MAG: LamG domain-containing protein [Deltaproteobacteria bacterium]|nr:LamG domain-containing protein [Deltaproteobacteria bacterium]
MTRTQMSMRQLIIPFVALVACADQLGTTETEQAIMQNQALRIAGVGFADTDAMFSDFWTSPFTMTAWINPEFAYGYYGPVFASTGDASFWLGMGNYRDGNGGVNQFGSPVISLKIAGQLMAYEAHTLLRGNWNHLALRRTPASPKTGLVTYEVYVNGQKLVPIPKVTKKNGLVVAVTQADLTEPARALVPPPALLRLGRAPDRDYEFYGLVDDVRIYNEALDPEDIGMAALSLESSLPTPLRQYTFDEPGTDPASTYAAGYAVYFDAVRVSVAGTGADAAIFADPKFVSPTRTAYRLPFPRGDFWTVLQEFDDPFVSHNGYAAWSWDFARAFGKTLGAYVTAPADGDIASVYETHHPADGETSGNKVTIVHAGGEITTALHLEPDSWTRIFLHGTPQPRPDQDDPATWYGVQQLEPIATAGDHSNDFHIAMRPSIDSDHTAPMAFVDYFASDDGGITFHHVVRGMPRKGQILFH